MTDPQNGRELEERLSAYIDALNRGRTPAAHRLGLPAGEAGLYVAVRSVRRLRDPAPPRAAFERHLLRSAGTPVGATRRQAGLVKAVALLALAGLVILVALLVLSGARPGPAANLLRQVAAMEADPAAAGLEAYAGRVRSVDRGDYDIVFMAPDKRWIRAVGSDRTYGTNGDVYWCYDAAEGVGHVAQQVDGWWGFFLLGRGQPFTKWSYLEPPTDHSRLDARLVGEEILLGRPVQVLDIFISRAPGAKTVAPGAIVARFWIDVETSLVLKEGQPLPDGQLLDATEFTSLDWSPDIGPEIFEPVFPEGTVILTHQRGDLTRLAEEVGWTVREPQGLPEGASPERAYLTRYPGGYEHASWQLTWFYPPLFEEGTTRAGMRVSVSNRDIAPDELGEPVVITPGMTGLCLHDTLVWHEDGLRYEVTCRALSVAGLVEVAASMIAGR